MGYSLSTLAKLPLEKGNEFYVFIIGGNANWKGGLLQTINENFDILAKEIGQNAIIAKGLNPREWTIEISEKYFSGIPNIDNLFPGILITNSHPDMFNDASIRILISLKQVESNYANTEQFFNLLTDFISRRNDKFLEFARANINWLDQINKSVELKPNIIGIGVNLNAIIDLVLNIKDKPIIDIKRKTSR